MTEQAGTLLRTPRAQTAMGVDADVHLMSGEERGFFSTNSLVRINLYLDCSQALEAEIIVGGKLDPSRRNSVYGIAERRVRRFRNCGASPNCNLNS